MLQCGSENGRDATVPLAMMPRGSMRCFSTKKRSPTRMPCRLRCTDHRSATTSPAAVRRAVSARLDQGARSGFHVPRIAVMTPSLVTFAQTVGTGHTYFGAVVHSAVHSASDHARSVFILSATAWG